MSALRFLVGLACAASACGAAVAPGTSCLQCHANLQWVQNEAWVKMVSDFATDVHAAVGLSCQDCHGGNPDPKLAEDPLAAMDPGFRPNPYRGATTRKQVPEFCGRCHSDAEYMKRFKPDARVDQLAEYWTSQHGKRLKTGDTRVATCVDCHGTHGIRRPADPQSRVYRTAVAETCRACHADPQRMAGYKSKDGQPLPIDQYERWRRSVHARAMFEKDDLSAPTCNDCHGNHGAVPPNLASITFVCGQCHGREAELFRHSPKERGFEGHNRDYLPAMGPAGCADCHEPPDPSAGITRLREFSECITCHGNHAIMPPTITMLGPLPDTPCAYCHEEPGSIDAGTAEPERIAAHYRRVKESLLAQAEAAGRKGDARFDWLVDAAVSLPDHRPSGAGPAETLARPHEFETLFRKFRIGRTHFTYPDPVTGSPVQEKINRCTDCHGPGSNGAGVSDTMSREMSELTLRTAQAQRTLLAAQRGGVEVRRTRLEVDRAADGEIALQALVHAFVVQTNSAFAQKRAAGMAAAQAALAEGQAALRELHFRRQGLWISLVIVLCVLVGLAFKIRELNRRDASR